MQKYTGTALLLMALWLAGACSSSGERGMEAATENTAASYKTFTYQAEGVAQTLQLRWQNDTAVTFVLEHQQGDCSYTLSGDAINPYLTYDPESDTDTDTGETYWVDLYLYNRDNCRMAIRMAQDTSKAQLQLSNCQAAPNCALQSLGMLRRER